jgi:hypothetical protein
MNLQLMPVGLSAYPARTTTKTTEADDSGFSLVPLGEETAKAVAQAAAPRGASNASAASRIRDRYILARFPGVMRKSEDLADTKEVIKSARLYFEDGHAARGLELLQFASEMDAMSESLWLARLEMLFLQRNADGFKSTVTRMQEFHADSTHWPQIVELGRNLGITEIFFKILGLPMGPARERGRLPEVPNWLQAPQDFAPEVAAAQLRSQILQATDGTAPDAGIKERA